MENSAADALKNGTVLNDRYVTSRVIGSGGFGITYLAYDTEDEKRVAIKEYYPKGVAIRGIDGVTIEPIAKVYLPDFQSGVERFRNESEILAKLGGRTDVISVYDSFAQNGTVYYAMEYIDGVTIKDYVLKNGKLSEEQVIYIARELAAAFGHIYRSGIIHRDITPDNIMIDSNGSVKLVDFGNARPFIADEENSMTVALEPGYAPPEQYRHHGQHGPWTDLYSLGAVLYFALTEKAPADPIARLQDDSEIKKELAGVNPKLAEVICRMIALMIEDRFRGSEEVLEGLSDEEDPPSFV